MRNVPSRCEPVSGGGGAREAAAASPGAQLSLGHYHSGVPGAFQEARVGVEVETGRGPPPFFPPITSFCQDLRDSRRPLEPVTLTVETSQEGPYQISQARTEASDGSSNDSPSSLSPKVLSEVLSDPSTSSSFNLLFFCCVLHY